MLEAEAAFVAAEKAVATDPKLLARVKKARLPTDFVMLERWDELRSAAAQSGQPWPLPASKQQAFQDFAAQAAAEGVTQIRESGCTSIVPCLQQEITLAPYPTPAPRPSPTAPAWAFDKCDVGLDGSGVGQCRCSSDARAASSPAVLRPPWESDDSSVLAAPVLNKTSAAVFLCPPCCDHGFELYGLDWARCTGTGGCRIRSHSGRCLSTGGQAGPLSFAPCAADDAAAGERFQFEPHSGELRPVSAHLSSLCVGVAAGSDGPEAGAAVVLGGCGGSTSRWAWDRTSAPQDSGVSLRLASTKQPQRLGQAAESAMCMHETSSSPEPVPLQVHDCESPKRADAELAESFH